MIADDIDIVKGGETVISVNFRASIKGIYATIKTLPVVEEFFRLRGAESNIKPFGRHWGDDLNVYVVPEVLTRPMFYEGGVYYLGLPGQGLILGKKEINLSFLAIVGVSDPLGVRFKLQEVISAAGMVQVGEEVKLALRKFYLDFIRPCDITVTLSSTEMRS